MLLTCFSSDNGMLGYCVVKPFKKIITEDGSEECNEFDCPLFKMEDRVEVIRSTDVNCAVSIVHHCTAACSFVNGQGTRVVEGQTITETALQYKHNYKNNTYCLNVYQMM